MKMIVARHSLLRVYLISSAVIWKYLGTLAGLERRWLRRSSSTMHNIASSSRLAILAQSSPRLLTYFQNTALVSSYGSMILGSLLPLSDTLTATVSEIFQLWSLPMAPGAKEYAAPQIFLSLSPILTLGVPPPLQYISLNFRLKWRISVAIMGRANLI